MARTKGGFWQPSNNTSYGLDNSLSGTSGTSGPSPRYNLPSFRDYIFRLMDAIIDHESMGNKQEVERYKGDLDEAIQQYAAMYERERRAARERARAEAAKSAEESLRQTLTEQGAQPKATYMDQYVFATVNPRDFRWSNLGFTQSFAEPLSQIFPDESLNAEEYEGSDFDWYNYFQKMLEKRREYRSSGYGQVYLSFKESALQWAMSPPIRWALEQMGIYDYEGAYGNPILRGQVENVARLYPGQGKQGPVYSGSTVWPSSQ